ncbi:hypothetical protein E2C01_059582 [Portunus trituberculatus]|uniref:Uncharacterized protein n=1 Tax=Portunus trituberculatus TaxID=210409 RepID=A0A5B7H8T7_PORTR|nr:hypothetical protein [Portunus trituberculatus]
MIGLLAARLELLHYGTSRSSTCFESLYESTSATTPDSLAESAQPSPEEDLECLSLPLSARASCMDWAASILASSLPSPHPHPRSRVYSSAPADELRVGQVPSFHQLYMFHGNLFEGHSTCQDNLGRQNRGVPGRVGVAVPATFCFCGVFVLS